MKVLPKFPMAASMVSRGVSRWIFHLGGLGLIPLGLLDASVVPVPGSMDLLTIILSAQRQALWPYYAVMATVGSVLGALVTYRLARKGEQEALGKRVEPKTLQKVQRLFDRWGLGAIAIPALLPPPVPMVPFVLAAGAAQYPVGKFLIALTLARAVRYTILAFLGARYGRHVFAFLRRSGHLKAVVAVALIAAVVVVLFVVLRSRLRTRTKH